MVGVVMGEEDVRDLMPVGLDPLEQWVGDLVAVDEDAAAARPSAKR